MAPPDWLIPAALFAGVAGLVAWNIFIGVRASSLPLAPKVLRVLSALCAFLLLPAQAISVLGYTSPGARVLGALAPLWPLLTVLYLAQGVWAFALGRAHRLLVTPLVLLSALSAWIAVACWMDGAITPLPAWVMTPGLAMSLLTAHAEAGALPWAAAAFAPALAPAAAARWRTTRAARVLAALGAAAIITGVGIEMPRAWEALASTQALDARGGMRARGDLAVGVRVFGPLSAPPSGAVARHDIALADSVAVTALQVTVDVDAASGAVLDSIARTIVARRDSLTLVVSLDLDDSPVLSERSRRARGAAVERIVRRLRPDVLVPSERVPHGVDVEAWKRDLESLAAIARRIDADVTVALGIDGVTPVDSALADWVLTQHPSLDAVALSSPRAGRPQAFDAALNALARWSSFSNAPASLWILGVPTAPLATGETAQAQLLRHALAWSAAQPNVKGIITGDASDVRAPTALSTAAGRPRAAVADVAAALRAARDIPAAPTPSHPALDSLAPPRAASPDSITPPSS